MAYKSLDLDFLDLRETGLARHNSVKVPFVFLKFERFYITAILI